MNPSQPDDYRATEKLLLAKSHPPAKVTELLEQRYSASGMQKSFLTLTPTLGRDQEEGVNVNTSSLSAAKGTSNTNAEQSKKAGGKRKSRLDNARAGLTDFIKKAQTAQRNTERYIQHTKATVTDSLLRARHVPLYEQYEPLHRLWQDYISSLLFGSTHSGQSQSTSTAHLLTLAGKLASADFHGALLTVTSAVNPSCVGLSGIVVWEAKTNFVLVVKSRPDRGSARERIGGLRIVEKRGSIFTFTTKKKSETNEVSNEEVFEIVGSRFLYRNADRSGRKFKAKAVDDL